MYTFDFILQMGLALLVSTIFGLISFFWGQRYAGVRVFILINLGCCLATYISINTRILVNQPWIGDPARIAAQLITAMGFIMAGIIWYRDNQVRGLSSAALLWVNAIIGIMIGAGYYRETVVSVLMVGIFLLLVELRYWRFP
ncbi:MAG: MgtC/SapB family protein [Methylocystaceae bacterium]